MNKKKHSDEKQKIILVFIGILSLLGVFWLILVHFEEKYPMTKTEQAMLEHSDKGLFEEEQEEPAGTVKFNGEKYSYFHEFKTYLFMGTDKSGNEEGKGQAYQGSMADFILVAIFDKTDGRYGLIQFDRDTMTEVTLMQKDGSGMAHANIQLCTAHWYGGNKEQSCANTVEAVSKLMGGIEFDGYYALSMEEVAALNHAVGGVEVTIEDDFSKVDSSMKQGETLTLSDEQAHTYVCTRYDVEDETNISRMKRQRQYMKSVFEKIKLQMKSNPSFLNEMYKDLEETATTDISGKQISQIAQYASEGEYVGLFTPEGKSDIGQALGDGIDHQEFYLEKDAMINIMTEIYGLKKK